MHFYITTTNGTPESEYTHAVEHLTLDSDVASLMAEGASGNERVVEAHLILGETVYTFIGGQESTKVRSIVAPVGDAR